MLTVIAAVGVLIVHVTHVLAGFHVIDYKTFPTQAFYRFDVTAVQIFFLLSGFKISLSISNQKFSYLRYIIKRIFSIWFIYMLALIAYLIFRFYFRQAEFESLNMWDYISNILLLNGFNPNSYNTVVASGWFIGCIIIYYAITPLLLKVFNNSNKAIILCSLTFLLRCLTSLLSSFPLFGIEKGVWEVYLSQSFPMHLCFYTLGILSYNLIIKKDLNFKWPAYLSFIVFVICAVLSKDHLIYDSIIIFIIFLILSNLKVDSEKHTLIPKLARYTLPVYLFQMLLLRSIAMFVDFKDISDWGIWIITFISSLIILFSLGALIYHLITKNTDKLYLKIFKK